MRGIRGLGVAAGIATTLLGASARAETGYPVRPIHVVVPYPAGGIVDIVARAITEQIGRDWKQAIIVDANGFLKLSGFAGLIYRSVGIPKTL